MRKDPTKMPKDPSEKTEDEFRSRMRGRSFREEVKLLEEALEEAIEAKFRFIKTCKKLGFIFAITFAIAMYFLLT